VSTQLQEIYHTVHFILIYTVIFYYKNRTFDLSVNFKSNGFNGSELTRNYKQL